MIYETCKLNKELTIKQMCEQIGYCMYCKMECPNAQGKKINNIMFINFENGCYMSCQRSKNGNIQIQLDDVQSEISIKETKKIIEMLQKIIQVEN